MMARATAPSNAKQIHCTDCPIRQLPAFRAFTAEELDFVWSFKRGELHADKGATIVQEGSHSAHLYTVLSGWAFRYKLLSDGRRQILNYLVPGDLIGLQSGLIGEMQHSVEALTPMSLCVFERDNLAKLYRKQPELAFDVTWIASREEQMLDENLLSIGRRSAIERAAYLIAFLCARLQQTHAGKLRKPVLPLTQQHIADTLGLSLVHTNRTLRRLAARGFAKWGDRGCEVLDADGLMAIAQWEGLPETRRPFI
jgi:CRP-like cAMP-binding protein